MRGRTIVALFITIVLVGAAQILAQSETSPTPDEGPQGAADGRGVFNPIWIILVAVGFVVFVMAGLLWRRRQRPGDR